MKPYGEYKETGLAWLERIPKHWEIARCKTLFAERNERSEKGLETHLSMSQKYGLISDEKLDEKRMVSESYAGGKLCYENDIVLNRLKAHLGVFALATQDGVVSPDYTVLSVNIQKTHPKFAEFLLKSQAFRSELRVRVRGVVEGFWRLYTEDFNSIYIALPPRAEQDKIVQFLDHKLAKIHTFIENKKKLIALLQEQKQAIINLAVTKGLDPHAEMKDSGVEWLGEVPKRWEILRGKYLFKERDERSEHGEETHLSMSQKYGLIADGNLDEKRMLSESYAGAKLCYENDIVLNRLKAHLGVFALASEKGVISPDYTVLQVNGEKLYPKFTELLLKSNALRKELRIRVRGVVEGFWRLYTEDFNAISFAFPSLSEQRQIVAHLKDKCVKIDTAIAKYQTEIDLIQEYKTSLVSAVVMGQVSVQNTFFA